MWVGTHNKAYRHIHTEHCRSAVADKGERNSDNRHYSEYHSDVDKAMDKQLQVLQQQIEKLKNENSSLSKKNQDLQKALNKKDLNFIKNL